jgi:hypothetical protein
MGAPELDAVDVRRAQTAGYAPRRRARTGTRSVDTAW